MMSEECVPDVGLTSSIVDPDFETVVDDAIAVECSDDHQKLLSSMRGDREPLAKRIKLEDSSLSTSEAISIKQILFNINQAICLRLDAIETKLEAVCNTTKLLEDKIEHLCANQISQNNLDDSNASINNGSIPSSPAKENSKTPSTSGRKSSMGGGAVVVGMPQSGKSSDGEDITSEKYVVSLAGSNMNKADQNVQNFGSNVTLITLNSEDDFPQGTWLGDENNPEMRVRVPVSPSDLLHIHSNCRTAERMALTLLDYLFDRETQAYSNLSGMGKHGKKQLDPLMIYGVRCHLIHHFNITEHDWHRIKQNINSKCRTAFRRKIRGLPLNVKAFRGKSPATYIHVPSGGLQSSRLNVSSLGSASDDDLNHDDSELQIQTEVDVSHADLLGTPATAEIIQGGGGHIQVLHATPEQVAQLQQTHQIQILQGDQLMQFQDNQQSVHVAVPFSQSSVENIQVINAESGEHLHITGSISQDIVSTHRIPKVEEEVGEV